ncbi:hypothetical protein [Streptomyces malaysiensis]|uniref:hypothetical protein n=1 Tax=Streptomyces malaysiensis TaxID=92644 RepID=UPI00192CEB1A|nr:hypothetical protein [Streptomyces autolyticus]
MDLSVLGLLLGTRYLALQGANREQLRPARRLLIFSSVMTLALNVADPLLAGQNGKAAFDAVGPSLLIGWAKGWPGLLQAIGGLEREKSPKSQEAQECSVEHTEAMIAPESINIDQKQTNFLSSSEADHRTQHGSDGGIFWNVRWQKTPGIGRLINGRFQQRRCGSGCMSGRPDPGCWSP